MKNNLVIVAHPDDETIWMGGTILHNKDQDWTIISLCRKNDADRMPKFMKVCERLNAKGIISDLDDEKLTPLSTEEVVEKIKEALPQTEYDCIYTHGENGEYGHIRHKEVHRAVTELIAKGELKCKKAFYFDYAVGDEKVPSVPGLRAAIPQKDAKIKLNLSKDNFKKKRLLVNHEYGFRGDSFEVLSCSEIETFKTK
jgi:LmbE family N-acetylglucosaminyl deacetylase